MPVVRLSPPEMVAFASEGRDPAIRKLEEITARYVTQQGGLLERIWRLHQGYIFGEPIMMTTDEIAKQLKLPLSEITAILAPADQAIHAQWRQTDEFRDSHFANQ